MPISIEHFERAIALRDAGKEEEALREFEVLASATSDTQERISLIGNQVTCLIRLGRIGDARARWNDGARLGTNCYADFMDACLCVDEGKREEAVGKFILFLQNPIDNAYVIDMTRSIDQETYMNAAVRLGRLLLDLGPYPEAIPPLEEALKLAVGIQRKNLLFYLAVCETSSKQWRAAEKKLSESLPREEADPLRAQTHYYLGICLFETGSSSSPKGNCCEAFPRIVLTLCGSWSSTSLDVFTITGELISKRGKPSKCAASWRLIMR